MFELKVFSSDKAKKPQKLRLEKGLTRMMKNNNSHNVEIITPLVQQKKISQATFTRTEASEVLEHHQEVTEPKNENTKRLLKNTALQRLHEKDYRAPVCL